MVGSIFFSLKLGKKMNFTRWLRVFDKVFCQLTLLSRGFCESRNSLLPLNCLGELLNMGGLIWISSFTLYAAVNGHLELTLLKGRQRFDAVSTSNLEVYKFRDWWIFTYFIFGHGESAPNNIWSTVNLERTCVLYFYYFLYFKVNFDLEKTYQLGESPPNFIFSVVNLDPIILEKRWIDDESWPNDFVEKGNKVEDLRWVGSRCPLTRA